jgi:hypothetical protein
MRCSLSRCSAGADRPGPRNAGGLSYTAKARRAVEKEAEFRQAHVDMAVRCGRLTQPGETFYQSRLCVGDGADDGMRTVPTTLLLFER